MTSSIDGLADEIVRSAGDLEAAMCRWLGLVAEFDRREGWAAEGCRCCSAWVSWRCGISPAAARERVRIARRLEALPLVRGAFASGTLTYSKVRALTRIEDIEREEELVELARHATAAQLERMVRAYCSVAQVEAGTERAHAERSVTWHYADDGSLVLNARMPAEQGAVVIKAIEAARDAAAGASAEAPGAESSPGDQEPVEARNADALVAVADSSLASADPARTGGDRFQIVVHVDADALATRSGGVGGGGGGTLDRGPALAPETVRRLACDASVVAILERDGRPLSVGRKTRSIPPALRRALRSRDGGCQFPGCLQHRHVDAHHIEHWAHGGETKMANLVLLCRHHHRLLHEGGFTLAGSPGGLVFRRPDGRPLRQVQQRRGPHGPLPKRARRDAPIQASVEPMNLSYAVDALLDFAPLRAAPPPGSAEWEGRRWPIADHIERGPETESLVALRAT